MAATFGKRAAEKPKPVKVIVGAFRNRGRR